MINQQYFINSSLKYRHGHLQPGLPLRAATRPSPVDGVINFTGYVLLFKYQAKQTKQTKGRLFLPFIDWIHITCILST